MNEELTQDLKDLLEFKRAGHMGRWEYSAPATPDDPVNGISLFKEFLTTHPEYYIPMAEKNIALHSSIDIHNIIKEPISLVSLGPGEVENFKAKELTLTSAFNAVTSIQNYDQEKTYLQACSKECELVRPGAIIKSFQKDIFGDFKIASNQTILATMFGGTLFNEEGFANAGPPIQTTIKRLRVIRNAIGKGFFFISVDQNQDRIKVENAYAGQGAFARNLVHLFNRDTSYQFDFDSSKFRVEWHSKSNLLAHYLTLGKNEYHFNNSYKLPETVFLSCVKSSGFKPLYKTQSLGVHGYLLETI